MKTLHATVRNGRLVMDEPTELPEGAVVELIPSDGDGLDEEERRALHADLDGSWAQTEAGKMRARIGFVVPETATDLSRMSYGSFRSGGPCGGEDRG